MSSSKLFDHEWFQLQELLHQALDRRYRAAQRCATPSSINRHTNDTATIKLSSPPPKHDEDKGRTAQKSLVVDDQVQAASRSVQIPLIPQIDGWKFKKKETVEDLQRKKKAMGRRVVSPASPITQTAQRSCK
ncbi:unnamed protein product [Linum trigynum]|uniref:Uncharacterized protein n=1 Tax=Linum trigynum TaxID=586398 RepID=A0AAV2GA13_9ROSI